MIHPRKTCVLLLAAALTAAWGCEDPFAPEPTPVPGPSSVVLHDHRAGPLIEPSAYDVFSSSSVRTDQSGGWDFLFFVTEEGDAQLRPRGAVVEGSSEAGLQLMEEPFEALLEVPADGYTTDAPVSAVGDAVYAVRSRTSSGCTRYAKAAVDSVDVGAGRLFLTTVVNPNCNRRSVEPEEQDEGE